MLMVFREQQKLNSSYLSYLIYQEATFIMKLTFPILFKRKNNKNYLHPLLHPLHTKVYYPQCSHHILAELRARAKRARAEHHN